ncbi:protein-tyrosine phosphatase [Kitasatospora sp. SolWspMP-SS2h]|uniref:tyrosine-protein phosphatase n=1 Tax=Kitasatospora sp. SolWspMP-SS2h TaxID=1305729 RepID=UPI000DB9CD2B|nr:tyrosine-protein phosphatase [Kitasatospora sp. SolWspMP-SS2h]RAJ38610.1 protein-tyrosine phosphatase [Kitasatospora sp. SolWspMP-SS2h]
MTETEIAAAPFLDIPDVPNLRDAGSGVYRPGLLYRSATLHHLTDEGLRRLTELGIRTVLDLRSAGEVALYPDRLPDGATYLHLPMLPDPATTDRAWPEDQSALYPFMAETGGIAIAAAVRALATGAPLLVHCAVGKDRTGLTVAALQTLAGLPLDAVTTDFLRSNAGLGLDLGPVPYLDAAGVERLSRPVEAAHLHAALTHATTRHGSLAAYLRDHGATDADLATLRSLGPS